MSKKISWRLNPMMNILVFKSLVGVTFSILILVYGVSNVYSEQLHSLSIKTVDNENRPMNAETVSWWFVDDPDKQITLQCKQSNCSKWLIRNKKPLEIGVYVFASIVRESDPHCWDWFEGEAKNQIDQNEITITLLKSSTVCK